MTRLYIKVAPADLIPDPRQVVPMLPNLVV